MKKPMLRKVSATKLVTIIESWVIVAITVALIAFGLATLKYEVSNTLFITLAGLMIGLSFAAAISSKERVISNIVLFAVSTLIFSTVTALATHNPIIAIIAIVSAGVSIISGFVLSINELKHFQRF